MQYCILTRKGKIVESKPPLPLEPQELAWVNEDAAETLIERLQTKMEGIIHCQVIPTHIDWAEDQVLHILTTNK